MKLKIVTIICLHLDRRAKCVSMKVRCCLSPEDWRRLDTVGPLPAAGDPQPMAADNDQDYNYINEQFRCGASPILL